MLILSISFAFAQAPTPEESAEISKAGSQSIFKKAATDFAQGKYASAIDELTSVENVLSQRASSTKESLGLAAYWKGICYNRLQNFPKAIESFDRALSYDYRPLDIHYEYGQALFAAEKLQEARLQFRESLKKKFKRGVSLYYIGYISRELGDRKKAVTFFKAIQKLPEDERNEVTQAAEFQIGDIYLDQVEKSRDAFRSVEKFVIPQYQRAISVDPASNLATPIREKIVDLQRKYDLIMFNLRNGRPVANPPYFLRAAIDNGFDTNVTFSPTETTVSKSKQSSLYTRGDIVGRYTFYNGNWMSIAPELRFNYTYYHHRIPEIYRNDNYLIAPAIRTAYEHTLFQKPAATLLDYDFSQSQKDINAKKQLVFSSRTHALMIGERFNFFKSGETFLRMRYRMFDSYNDATDSKTISVSWEQVVGYKESTFLFYTGFDRSRVENDVFDTNSLTVRGDWIVGRIGNIGTPSIGVSMTSTDPINDRSNRGREFLINPNARLAKVFWEKWRANFKYDYSNNHSKDENGFAYKKSVYSVEIEYLF